MDYSKVFFTDDFPCLPAFDSDIDFDFVSFKERGRFPSSAIHFYIDDVFFETVWRSPARYLDCFRSVPVIVMPDFSMYSNYPTPVSIYNKFRNHWLANYYSIHGVKVIPNVNPCSVDSLSWSLLGFPQNSVIAFSDVGAIRDPSIDLFGLVCNCLHPSKILYFTSNPSSAPADVIPVKVGDCFGKGQKSDSV